MKTLSIGLFAAGILLMAFLLMARLAATHASLSSSLAENDYGLAVALFAASIAAAVLSLGSSQPTPKENHASHEI